MNAAERDIDADTVAFAERLLRMLAEDPLVSGRYRAAARKHLAKLRREPERQLSADDFKGARG